jgi:uncharacterized protein with PIN domain
MNIVDSSGWLAYFADEPNAQYFLTPLNDSASLVVPTVTIYEVFKVVLRESGENDALQAAAAMQKGTVVALTVSLAIAASKLSIELFQWRTVSFSQQRKNSMPSSGLRIQILKI